MKHAILLLDSAFDKLSYASYLYRDIADPKQKMIFVERNLFEKGKAGEKASLVLQDLAQQVHKLSTDASDPSFASYYQGKDWLFDPQQVSALVYNAGPGSFVGTRIACTQAQALALVYQAPVVRCTSGQLVANQFSLVFSRLLREKHFQPSAAFQQALEAGIDLLVAFDANMSEAYCRWYRLRLVNGNLLFQNSSKYLAEGHHSVVVQLLLENGQQQESLELDLHTAELKGADPKSKVLQQNADRDSINFNSESDSQSEADTSTNSLEQKKQILLNGEFILNKEQLLQVVEQAKAEFTLLIGNAWQRYAPAALELESFFSNPKLLHLFEHEFAYLAFLQQVIGMQLEEEELQLVKEQDKFLAILNGEDLVLKAELQKQLQEGIFLKYDVCQFPNWGLQTEVIIDQIINNEFVDKYEVLPNYVRNHVTF